MPLLAPLLPASARVAILLRNASILWLGVLPGSMCGSSARLFLAAALSSRSAKNLAIAASRDFAASALAAAAALPALLLTFAVPGAFSRPRISPEPRCPPQAPSPGASLGPLITAAAAPLGAVPLPVCNHPSSACPSSGRGASRGVAPPPHPRCGRYIQDGGSIQMRPAASASQARRGRSRSRAARSRSSRMVPLPPLAPAGACAGTRRAGSARARRTGYLARSPPPASVPPPCPSRSSLLRGLFSASGDLLALPMSTQPPPLPPQSFP
jgi:hypothetical protein